MVLCLLVDYDGYGSVAWPTSESWLDQRFVRCLMMPAAYIPFAREDFELGILGLQSYFAFCV